MKKDYLSLAIRALVGADDFAYTGETYETIQWVTAPSTIPTAAQVAQKIVELKETDAAAVAQKATEKAALLERLGITADEAALLLG
jgi:hypothetical protein